jgi:exodeoxyribonuclease V alpha subunit
VYAEEEQLVKAAITLLEADEENIRQAMADMIREEKLMMEQEAIYLPPFYHSECGTAKRLLTLMNASDNGKHPKFDLKAIEKETGIEYDEVQIAAIRQAVVVVK